jgi:hypothetical protein
MYQIRKTFIILGVLIFIALFGNELFPVYFSQDLILEETIYLIPGENTRSITRSPYTEMVEITLSGFLISADGTRSIDAYYDFSHLQQLQAQTILDLNENILLPPYGGGSPPPFADNHTYTFLFWVGYEEQFLEFSLNTDYLRSYEGQLSITVRTFPNWGGR